MTTFNLRQLRLRSGEQFHDTVEVEIEPLVLGGQEYAAVPASVPAELTVARASSGTILDIAFRVRLQGPCFRCLADAALEVPIRAREYQATSPGDDDDLRSPYVHDDVLELSAWAHDALALELPDKILHDPECAGLCPVCGKDLNVEPHQHDDVRSDPRWAALESLRDSTTG
ncbi:MAG TPA: DUF177 domain-containing protein [Gaiellaceae bacterium]|nr:DUF177 domain-containing protein [Gaiellaceae bacterium]